MRCHTISFPNPDLFLLSSSPLFSSLVSHHLDPICLPCVQVMTPERKLPMVDTTSAVEHCQGGPAAGEPPGHAVGGAADERHAGRGRALPREELQWARDAGRHQDSPREELQRSSDADRTIRDALLGIDLVKDKYRPGHVWLAGLRYRRPLRGFTESERRRCCEASCLLPLVSL
jgi:hypothetical protein